MDAAGMSIDRTDDKDRVWDDELGYHRCPLGHIQTPREIVSCRETVEGGGLELYVQQLEREEICDVVVVDEDEQEVCIRAVTCAFDHDRADYPDIVIVPHRWYKLPPLKGRDLFDVESDDYVWVEGWDGALRGGELAFGPESEVGPNPDLDIPF
jgi:hypothetical protein